MGEVVVGRGMVVGLKIPPRIHGLCGVLDINRGGEIVAIKRSELTQSLHLSFHERHCIKPSQKRPLVTMREEENPDRFNLNHFCRRFHGRTGLIFS
jgi:hypothetical protein